jgi:hypothetical protein
MPTGKCKLCLQTKALMNSHLMPAALYRKSRQEGAQNPNPIILTSRGSVRTSRQTRDYVLCGNCEGLFSRNGEKYVMGQVFDGNKFPMLDTLHAVPSIKMGPNFEVYDQAMVPGIDRERLAYFALSVFWRASAHAWKRPDDSPITIDLGPYSEVLRKFLLGETAFPENVVLHVIVCTDSMTQDIFYMPGLVRKQEERTYSFQARGLNFFMTVGKRIPEQLRELCCISGPRRFILTRSCEGKSIEFIQSIKSSRRSA